MVRGSGSKKSMTTGNKTLSASSDVESATSFESLSEHAKLEAFVDASFSKSTEGVAFHVNQDPMWRTYNYFTPQWAEVIRDHMSIHELSSFDYDASESQLAWIHTSIETLKDKLEEVSKDNPEIQLGPRFVFPSSTQALMHKTVHALYGLSHQTVSDTTVALCLEVPIGFLDSNERQCRNGFALILEEIATPSMEMLTSLLQAET
eukprot:4575221-Amphidinium_carterae.1